MTGTLYLVPTPIGNLGDLSPRAKETLESCDFVACEDTRVCGKLLFLLGIKKELVQHREHNKKQSAEYIAERLLKGESCALTCDAGTPAVSDPGEVLVAVCRKAGIRVVPLPGACAAVCALSACGLPTRRFVFEGFLPDKGKERKGRLAELAKESRTAVVYTAPHDLTKDLADLAAALGNRRLVLARELTKINEQILQTTLQEALSLAESGEIPQKGEMALVIEGAPESAASEDAFWADMDIPAHVAHYRLLGFSKMDAVKKAARDRGLPKSAVYDEVQ